MANPAKELTRRYFDSLFFEQKLMDSAVPDTTLTLYGQKFQTPIATAALSHLGTFYPDSPNGMVHYARGALKSGAVHFVGMSEMEEYDAIAKTGAACIRIIKPYADEEEIFSRISQAEQTGALAVGMDIDHMFDGKGHDDLCMGKQMRVKSCADLRKYAESTQLPFVIKGVLSVHDALLCRDIGAKGIVVSHHGGRFKAAVPPLFVLPEIAKALDKSMPIFVDCGVASGLDAFKALALGATAVSVGGHLIPAARESGEKVAARILEMTNELRGAMAFTGTKTLKDLSIYSVYLLR